MCPKKFQPKVKKKFRTFKIEKSTFSWNFEKKLTLKMYTQKSARKYFWPVILARLRLFNLVQYHSMIRELFRTAFDEKKVVLPSTKFDSDKKNRFQLYAAVSPFWTGRRRDSKSENSICPWENGPKSGHWDEIKKKQFFSLDRFSTRIATFTSKFT